MDNKENTWLSITEIQGCDYLDFSVNTNSLGVPDTVCEHFPHLIHVAGFYPDMNCSTLTIALAEKYVIPSTCLLCGNGADDLLYRIVFALKPQKALIIEPTFEEYNRALELVDCDVCHYQSVPEKHFEIDSDILQSITKDLDIMILCNPNNPTGNLIHPQLLSMITEKCIKENVLMIVDECFIEFIQNWKAYSLKQQAAISQNLVVIDAFTKTYSLAGFRLGFCITGNHSLLEKMKSQGQSYGVSVPAQFAGICALIDKSYMQKTYSFLASERDWLYSQLLTLKIDVWPSWGNFLLLRARQLNLQQKLLERRIKTRDCSCFHGLGPEYCRIAVRSHGENELFIKAVQAILT